MNKLRIGLLLASMRTDQYVCDFLAWASSQDQLEVAALIVCRPVKAASAGAPARHAKRVRTLHELASTLSFRMVMGVEAMLLQLSHAHRTHLNACELKPGPQGSKVAYVRLIPAPGGQRCHEDDIATISALELDLLVQCSAPVLAGAILSSARLGTIGLDFQGRKAGQTVPPGFWEAYEKMPKTEFEIRHLTPQAASACVLVEGSFRTKYLFLLNQATLYRKAGAQLKDLLGKIAATGTLPAPQVSQPYSGRSFAAPEWHQNVTYLGKAAFRILVKGLYKSLNIRQKWGISYIHSNWKNAALWRSTRLSAPRGHFWADPFVCNHNGKTYCFVEDFVYKTGRAHITALELTEQGAVTLGDSIREEFHLSFPYLFHHDGALFMCPESSEARQIRIYRCRTFPLEWELCAIPMRDLSAADSMFFEHAGKWWLLTNIDRSGLDDHCSELYLFHAASPFDTHWTAHPQNPLRIDSEGGRNAGLILEDGKIFRAAQRQGFDQYGQGLMLYEITTLSETVYAEQLVSAIDCRFRPGLLGAHHLSTTGKITVFDHVGRSFFP